MKPAHIHLISALAAELSERVSHEEGAGPIRLLDIGCGYGRLICDLLAVWPTLGDRMPEIEVYGFEVYDHRAGIPGYREELLNGLSQENPEIDWANRIRFCAASESWPFPDHFFVAAFSNQVLEHVQDLESFFVEQNRVVKPGGVGLHFYPAQETIVEPHCGVPFAHRVRREELKRWLRLWSRIGAGKFRSYHRKRGSKLDAFCDEFYGYLGRYVYFRPDLEILKMASGSGCSAGFSYSKDLALRGLKDDWEPFPYTSKTRLGKRSLLAAIGCSTLVQRFSQP